jgi:hypothetical protein
MLPPDELHAVLICCSTRVANNIMNSKKVFCNIESILRLNAEAKLSLCKLLKIIIKNIALKTIKRRMVLWCGGGVKL